MICADILLVLDNQRCAPRGSSWVEISGLRIFSGTATGGTTLKDLGYRAPIRALLPTLPACREYVASVSSSELCVITGPDPAQRGLDSWFTGTHRGPFIVFFKGWLLVVALGGANGHPTTLFFSQIGRVVYLEFLPIPYSLRVGLDIG